MKMYPFLKQNLTTYCLFILVWVYDLDMFLDQFCEIHSHQSQAGTGSKWIVHSSATYIIQLNVLDSMQGEAWLKWGRIDFPNGRFDAVTCHCFTLQLWERGDHGNQGRRAHIADVIVLHLSRLLIHTKQRERKKEKSHCPHYDP